MFVEREKQCEQSFIVTTLPSIKMLPIKRWKQASGPLLQGFQEEGASLSPSLRLGGSGQGVNVEMRGRTGLPSPGPISWSHRTLDARGQEHWCLPASPSLVAGVSHMEARQPGKPPHFSLNWVLGSADVEVIDATTGKRSCGRPSRLCKHMLSARWAQLYEKVTRPCIGLIWAMWQCPSVYCSQLPTDQLWLHQAGPRTAAAPQGLGGAPTVICGAKSRHLLEWVTPV